MSLLLKVGYSSSWMVCPSFINLGSRKISLRTLSQHYFRLRPSVPMVNLKLPSLRARFFSQINAGASRLQGSKFQFNPSYLLAFGFPSLFQRYKNSNESHLSMEVMSNIPKEVFKKDILKRKPAKNAIKRLFSHLWLGIRLWLRFIRIVVTFTPFVVLYPLTYLSRSFTWIWYKTLLFAMEATGPTFIKLGQWASTRRDLFSADFCDLFSRLHHDSRTHSWKMTKRKMKRAFGKRWKEIFVKLEKEPIGSGCIAQVHKGYIGADMIPDEGLVEEILEELEPDDDPEEVDFAEGMEILSFYSPDEDSVEGDINALPEYKESYRSRLLRFLHLQKAESDPEAEEEVSDQGILEKTAEELKGSQKEENIKEYGRRVVYDDEGVVPLIPVAVKVLHPGVYTSVTRDLSILRFLAKIAEKIIPGLCWLSVSECMSEFSDLLTRQIDLRFEAVCLEQFVQNFDHLPHIRFPKPLHPYIKRDVLVETFEEGVPISEFLSEDTDHPEGIKETLALHGVDALLQMVFVDNFVHGDLHPGNILVQNAEVYTQSQEASKMLLVDLGDTLIVDVKPPENHLRLVMLDVGITTTLDPADMDNLKKVFTAVIQGDGDLVAELMLRHARSNQCSDVPGFKRELAEIVDKYRECTIALGKIKVGELLSSVFSVCTRYRVKMESNFAAIMLAIFVLEGLGRSLDPSLDILERAKPLLLHS